MTMIVEIGTNGRSSILDIRTHVKLSMAELNSLHITY